MPKAAQTDEVILRTHARIADVDAAAWDACANPNPAAYNPFVAHAFLKACEESNSATPRAGWRPMHATLEERGRVIAAAPLYLKSHSYGEYVFDQAWADAWERAGGNYYPKLLCAAPFTPVPGPRLLVPPGRDRADVQGMLLDALAQVTEESKLSSLHINFLAEDEAKFAAARGFLLRTDQQFHWNNRGYGSFAEFLAELSSQKRKTLRRERERVAEAGVTFEWITGSDLTESHWDAFFEFYMDTGSRKWGSPYLTRAFFSMLGEAMPERVLLVFAKRAGRTIAGALNFIGGDTLYGRNWGAIEHLPFLHFEACYYQAIDFAIAKGLKRVEAGAQGQHKLARGYEPVPTYSVHWIADPRFRRAVADYLTREREAVAADIEALGEHTPFRKGPRHSQED